MQPRGETVYQTTHFPQSSATNASRSNMAHPLLKIKKILPAEKPLLKASQTLFILGRSKTVIVIPWHTVTFPKSNKAGEILYIPQTTYPRSFVQ